MGKTTETELKNWLLLRCISGEWALNVSGLLCATDVQHVWVVHNNGFGTGKAKGTIPCVKLAGVCKKAQHCPAAQEIMK